MNTFTIFIKIDSFIFSFEYNMAIFPPNMIDNANNISISMILINEDLEIISNDVNFDVNITDEYDSAISTFYSTQIDGRTIFRMAVTSYY